MSQFLRQKICLYRLSPVSIDLIEPNLYLGSRSAAEDPETLKKYNITHILTIDDIPLPDEFTKKQNLTTKCICLSDQPREDLLSHLDDTYAFISEGLSKGSVLVHCFFGVSRSASLVIAFIMRKHHMPYERAFEKVRRRRNRVWPNTGFVTQLRLYQEMGYKVDSLYPNYKIYRLHKVANQVRKVRAVPHDCMDVIQDDPGLAPLAPEAKVFCCKGCSRVLADESHLIPHMHQGEICNLLYFVFPIAWMDCCKTVERGLCCPKCNAEVGSFNWNVAIRCPCDATKNPAFCLKPDGVKFIKVSKL
ncbi:hypothetical protein Zmor_013288 [Zophobas morio]|uniref:Protein-tyrosine-phosphatase n=1 Tax=Zophobas morio TaxID=2755281 RepID=A0AA38ID81_9CUCU|nr:hypothetical protein Zmor_013288 [Zophobas morio]